MTIQPFLAPNDPLASGGEFPLALHAVSKRWGHLQVLRDVDLELEAGRLTWIGGANGVGKTTLLRIAAGLILPDAGFARVNERLHPERDRRAFLRHVGYLSAGNGGLYARLTTLQHLDLAARLTMLSRAERREAIDDALERFGLREVAKRRVDRMSTGQRQRLRLAVALVHRPSILLLDEPFNSLDEAGIDCFCSTIASVLAAGGVALVCAPGGLALPIGYDAHFKLVDGELLAA